MKSRILTMSLVVALAAALIGGATMSLFTTDAQTADRTYAAGTLEVDVGDQVIEIGSFGCMAPGDTLEGKFNVKNKGSLKLWFDVTPITKRIEGSDNNYLFSGDNGAQVIVVGQDTEEPWVLEAGKDKDISFEVHLPLDAGNWYQEAEGMLFFKVHAEQVGQNDPYDPTVSEFRVKDFKIEWEFLGKEKASFVITEAKNAFGYLITTPGKNVKLTLEYDFWNNERWDEVSKSVMVGLLDGESEGIETVLGYLGFGGVENVRVTIDGVTVDVPYPYSNQ